MQEDIEEMARGEAHADDGRLLLYLSVPFCPKQCDFCRVRSIEPSSDLRASYWKALTREMEFASPDFQDRSVPALWIGGGIAGHMFDEELGAYLRHFDRLYRLEDNPEITLKVYPGVVSVETVEACRRGHVTRLSVEFVTCDEAEHENLGRFLGVKAMDVTKMILTNTDFDLSFDMVVGAPGQTEKSLERSLEAVVSYGAAHVSLFPFELVSGSVLERKLAERERKIARGAADGDKPKESPRRHVPSADERDGLLAMARDWLCKGGFHEYLPLQFALPGHECRYRQLEAAGTDTLGFGMGAQTSFCGVRSRNTDDLATYIRYSAVPERCSSIL